MTSSSSASTTQPQGVQPPAIRQWVTPALLMSLLALLVVVSFSLLSDLRSSQAEMRADFRNSQAELLAQMQSSQAEMRADFRNSQAEMRADLREFKQEVQTAIGGVNTRMDQLSGRMDAMGADVNQRLDQVNGRIDLLYQLLAPPRQPDLQT